jgi:hypothetical protein
MELSKMFGVERDVEFGVEMYGVSTFKVSLNDDGIECLMIRICSGEWGLALLGTVLRVISIAPAGIIHLPPPLTDEQRVVLMSLFTIGARYMGMSREGWKRCFVNKPQKEFSGWTCGDTQALTIAHGMANCLDPLVSWSDPEPFDIGKALGVGE